MTHGAPVEDWRAWTNRPRETDGEPAGFVMIAEVTPMHPEP